MNIGALIGQLKKFILTEKAFFKNVSFVFGGKLIIAFASLVLTPIIARLYSPRDYGEFALYTTLYQNLVIICTLSLPLAISTAKKNTLSHVFSLSLSVIFILTFLASFLLYFFRLYLDTTFSTTLFSNYWYFISLAILSTSVVRIMSAMNIRLGEFKLNTKVDITEIISAKSICLTGGYLGLNVLGFILSDILSKIINVFILAFWFPKTIILKLLSFRRIFSGIKKYRSFPLYMMPSAWLGTISNQFVILLVGYLYNKELLGQLTMAVSLLNIPLNVLSNSFQPVITERLVALRDGEVSPRFFEKIMAVAATISFLSFAIIYILPEQFFTTFLGQHWEGIDMIVNAYCLLYVFLFLDQAFQAGFVILDKQKIKLLSNLLDVILLGLGGTYSIYQAFSFHEFLKLFIIIKVFISVFRICYLWRINRTN